MEFPARPQASLEIYIAMLALPWSYVRQFSAQCCPSATHPPGGPWRNSQNAPIIQVHLPLPLLSCPMSHCLCLEFWSRVGIWKDFTLKQCFCKFVSTISSSVCNFDGWMKAIFRPFENTQLHLKFFCCLWYSPCPVSGCPSPPAKVSTAQPRPEAEKQHRLSSTPCHSHSESLTFPFQFGLSAQAATYRVPNYQDTCLLAVLKGAMLFALPN